VDNISDHISYKEATKSNTATRKGIDNTPNGDQIFNMMLVANHCFEPLREYHDDAIGISSFFRSGELNSAIGGSQTSQHCAGEETELEEAAIDIDADIYNTGITNCEIFHFLKDNVEFDQLIWEFGSDDEPAWVHVSYRKDGNRGEILVAYKNEKKQSKYRYYEEV